MNFIRYAIAKPVTVAVGVILVALFGAIGLSRLPLQMTPDVTEPKITVTTIWPGASPYEVEKDIVEEQEKVLKGIPSLTVLESSSFNDLAQVTLTFEIGSDLDAALLRVSNALNEVPAYPENVQKPVIDASGASSTPVIWMMMKSTSGDPRDVLTYRTFFENEVSQHLERVPGVGSLLVFGGSEEQLEVVARVRDLARHGITLGRVMNRLGTANANLSAGTLGVGKKEYRVRTLSEFQGVDEPMDVVLTDDGIHRVTLRDVASSRIGHAPINEAVMHNGSPGIVVGVVNQQGANVVDMTRRMKRVVEGLNKGILAERKLHMDWVYDQNPYIEKAIGIVVNNVLVGSALAVMVLLLFLRSLGSVAVTALAIPISAVGTFIFLWMFDRSLNVVSLAGISFAVGMLVDNAIVVLENIDRHHNMGKSALAAAHDGASEVWGAVLASTLTTVAVFLPVIFMQDESGQLFKDIAIAITFAITLSLVVSVSVIPSASNQISRLGGWATRERFLFVGRAGSGLSAGIRALSRASIRNPAARFLTILFLTAASVFSAWALMPKAEYLPQGNRNLVLNILIPPPGYSLEKNWDMGESIWRQLDPYFKEDGKDGIPRMKELFYVGADRISLFGVISAHETEAGKMIPALARAANSFPGVFGVSIQVGLFQDRLGRGRTVDVNISGRDMETILAVARKLFGAMGKALPGAQVRPVPSLENTYPEANFIPDRARSLANGITEQELGRYVDVIMDGRKVAEYKPQQQKKIDLVLLRSEGSVKTPEDVGESLIVNGNGDLIRVSDIATLSYSQGMTQVDHLERQRTIRLEVSPTLAVPLQEALETIQEQVVDKMRAAGELEGTEVAVGGNADKLSEARSAMKWNLLLAVLIVYLLMSALFENFLYPLIILFSVPLAAGGGFVGLRLVDRFIAPQGFDIVTMLGFIILIGTVVNNAILIVHQSLNNVRYNGFAGLDAIEESVRTRIRPIFMSTTTSLFGMLPMVLSTGQGSELYRGLGSVILGGLAVSTLFTLFVIPAVLAFFIRFEKPRDPETGGGREIPREPEPVREGGAGASGAAAAGLVLLLAGGLAVGWAPEARGETLKELMDTAVSGRDLVKEYQSRVLKQAEDTRRARAGFLPRLDASYTGNRLSQSVAGNQLNQSALFENDTNSAVAGVVSYNLFSGFADRYGLAAAKDLEKVREYELATVKADVRLSVAAAYLDVFRSRSSLEVAEKNVELLEKRVAQARSRYEVGLSRKNEVLQIEVNLADARQAGKSARAEVGKNVNLLSRAVGAPVSPGGFDFSEFGELPRVKELSDYLAGMMEARSDLAALSLALSAAENEARAARAPLYPSVDLAGSVSRYGNDLAAGTTGEPHINEARATLGVTVNLFDGFSKYAGMARARLAAGEVRYRINELKAALSTDLHNTFLDYRVSVENLEVARAAISQAEENLRITDAGFAEGVETATDVLDAVFFLSRARRNLVDARSRVFLDWFRLLRLVEEI